MGIDVYSPCPRESHSTAEMSLPLAHSKRHSLQDISPCYEPTSGAAPPILPIILAQTEIGKTFSPGKLLAQEEIGQKHWTSPHEWPAGIRPKARGSDVRFSPYTMTVSGLHGFHTPSTGDSKSSTEHPDTHGDDAPQAPKYLVSDSASCTPLIPKPLGEAGRPGRGGYTFSKHVKLKKTELTRIKVSMFLSVVIRCYLPYGVGVCQRHCAKTTRYIQVLCIPVTEINQHR